MAQGKSNPIVQILLIMSVVFLAQMLFCNQKDPTATLTIEEILARYETAYKDTASSGEQYLVALNRDLDKRTEAEKPAIATRISSAETALAALKNTKTGKRLLTAARPTDAGNLPTEDLAQRFETSFQGLQAGSGAGYLARVKSEFEDKKVGTAQALHELEFEQAQLAFAHAEYNQNFDSALTAYQSFEKIEKELGKQELGVSAGLMKIRARDLASGLPKSDLIQLGYNIIDGLVKVTGNNPGFSYWFTCLFLAVVIRLATWPLSKKMMMGFKRMALLQPMVKELQQKYQGQELQLHMGRLYQRYGINPLGGCLPMLIQTPIFIWMYYCMNAYRFEFQHGTFLWVNPTAHAANPGIYGANLGERDAILVIIYGASMLLTTFLTPTDPTNAKMNRMMGIFIAVFFTGIMFINPFPSAFIVYWIGINIVSTVQSILINKKPIPPLVEIDPSQQKAGCMSMGMKPDGGPKQPGRWSGNLPTNGASGTGSSPSGHNKTGAPVLHKPKGKQVKKRKK